MKFYKEDSANYFYWEKIKNNKLTVTYFSNNIWFFKKNGKIHNAKNVAFIKSNGLKKFHLNGKTYGYKDDFTKESWRRFVKLHAFL